ncbi:MAG: Alanine--tRNA ligase [candidate division WS6 bacterium 34_10]|uniref:alanine--tRNA ligase n=1 Tax=candidate division WS6 bacterium 34_10 TaxID=1641389 RepID=A0A101HIE3_9BACT|nr:MAG: Alanine--tRNA ligase [candidate division WS6 bacterium 34_10]
MSKLKYTDIRDKYIQFFKNENHEEIPSAPLVPEDDPSVLFVNAGMFPLVPFLKGAKHPKGKRLVNSQRCLRTGDIDLVGDSYHCTTFEMLGNWSLNDYFKDEAINLTVSFFVEELGMDINKIYATAYQGDSSIPRDEESINIWKEIFEKYGIEAKVGKGERIEPRGKEGNWWGLESGGPCGPDSEIFYKTDDELVEIGNNVFMQYLLEDGEYKDLGRHNVDFGGGLDRLVAVIQEVDSIYETDIYKPILEKVQELNDEHILESERIIVDHIKAATWIVMDGIVPGKSKQGYVLRRLIRRAIRHGKKLNIDKKFVREVAQVTIEQFKDIYPKLEKQKENILKIIEDEEKKFNQTIRNGLKILEEILQEKSQFTGEDAFTLYETYGFPIEITKEILKEKGMELINPEGFEKAKKEHKEKSRSASTGMFKGGLADTSDMSVKYHTATHLLLAALQKVLGDHVYQKGSNITPERLRLDFPADKKLTEEQVSQVEEIVNHAIEQGYNINFKEMKKENALKLVPFAAFTEKYGDIVKVYYVGPENNPFSAEICNGPHVENTSELGKFKIVKQENVGAGVKRIKAVLE